MRAFCLFSVCVMLSTAACAPKDSQRQYQEGEVGISHAVEFGTILNMREVAIATKNTNIGTLGGGAVGAGLGSYAGSGSGTSWATAGGALVGAVAGYYAEQAMGDRTGYEYVVQLQSGEVKTIVQEKAEGDVVFNAGDTVMLQYVDVGDHGKKREEAGYQRLLPIKKLPPYVKTKRKFVQTRETGEYENAKPAKADDAGTYFHLPD